MSEKPPFPTAMKKQTLAEQMAEVIQEAILSGQLSAGEALPTEPELAGQFEVSRAVVRDATRILMARGLVEVVQGRGVFVTEPYNPAFGEALLLALRRVKASAWDVEQFEQVLFPEVVALAAASATDEEISAIRKQAEDYIEIIRKHHQMWYGKTTPESELERLKTSYSELMLAFFAATHNQVIQQLAQPLLSLRNLRQWADHGDETPDQLIAIEANYIRKLVEAVTSRDPDQARRIVTLLMKLPQEAIQAMKLTPVGEIARIPIPLPNQSRESLDP